MQSTIVLSLLAVLGVFSDDYSVSEFPLLGSGSGSGDDNTLPRDCAGDYPVDVCIDMIYPAAKTSRLLWAGSSDQHRFAASYYTHGLSTKEWGLPKDLGTHYIEGKSDIWQLSTDRLGCIHPADVANISYHAGSNDGWNIQTAFTFANLSNGRLILLTADAGVNGWVDGNRDEDSDQFDLNRHAVEQNCRRAATQCVDKLFVVAHTLPGEPRSYSGGPYGLKVQCGKRMKHVKLANHPGNFYLQQNKADMWVIEGTALSRRNRCLKYGDITDVAFTAHDEKNFQLQSAFVVAQLDSGKFALLTADVDQLIDFEENRKFELTIQKC